MGVSRISLFVPMAVAIAFAVSSGCGAPAPTFLTRDELMDPVQCKACHADHFRDWSSSMHAYASDDPIFLAMNRRGQRETGGALGGFCVKCHAPMAVATGATTDGQNLATLPSKLKGVTCFFCHDVDSVAGTHDNPLHLATDDSMRGPFSDPAPNSVHQSSYSKLDDRNQLESAQACGACHDIVNGHGAAIERTYEEWQATVFSHPPGGNTCGQCHMNQSSDLRLVAQTDKAKKRRYHAHDYPAVDQALTALPGSDTLLSESQSFLDSSLQSALCVGSGGAGIEVILDNVAAGHNWPSGAVQDRRAWIEVIGYAGDSVVYQSGVVPDGTAVTTVADPDLWLLRDCMLDDASQPVPMFWQAVTSESYGLPGQITFDALDPNFYKTHVYQRFPRQGALTAVPDRVTMRVRITPIGLDVVDDLIASGDLDPAYRASIPVFDVGSAPLVTWTAATATQAYVENGTPYTCVSTTNLNFQADKVQAPPHVHCTP